jgi:hypothetical protein
LAEAEERVLNALRASLAAQKAAHPDTTDR